MHSHTCTRGTYQVEVVKDLRGPLHLPQNPEHLLVEETTVVLEVHVHLLLQQQSQLLTGHLLQVLVEHHLPQLGRQDLLQCLALATPIPRGRGPQSATATSLMEECGCGGPVTPQGELGSEGVPLHPRIGMGGGGAGEGLTK